MVTGTVGVWLSKVTQGDRAVSGANDFSQVDFMRMPSEDVAATDPSFRTHQPGPLEREQNLLEVRLGQPCPFGDVADRRRPSFILVQCQGQQGTGSIVAAGGDSHFEQPTAIVVIGKSCKRHWTRPAALAHLMPMSDAFNNGAAASGAPISPAYRAGCLTDVMPSVSGVGENSLPIELEPGPRVLLVLDGLGWEQLQQWSHLMPTVSAFQGGPITTVAPSTTATALTSLTTSLPPSQHGLVGYRMMVDGSVFNCLRWSTAELGDCRSAIPPSVLQPFDPFLGESIPLVTKAEFRRSGFSQAHLRGGRLVGYRTIAVLVHEVARLVREGEPVVYAYYDGVDKVAHEYGLRSEYEAELRFTDRLVAALVDAVPTGTQVIVTADHGQVDCPDSLVHLHDDVADLVDDLSGEARFRWLHSAPDRVEAVRQAAAEHHGDDAWVRSRDEILDEGWFGTGMTSDVIDRLGDVALLPFTNIGYHDPKDTGPFELIGRHGSLTSAEMYVPCVSTSA